MPPLQTLKSKCTFDSFRDNIQKLFPQCVWIHFNPSWLRVEQFNLNIKNGLLNAVHFS